MKSDPDFPNLRFVRAALQLRANQKAVFSLEMADLAKAAEDYLRTEQQWKNQLKNGEYRDYYLMNYWIACAISYEYRLGVWSAEDFLDLLGKILRDAAIVNRKEHPEVTRGDARYWVNEDFVKKITKTFFLSMLGHENSHNLLFSLNPKMTYTNPRNQALHEAFAEVGAFAWLQASGLFEGKAWHILGSASHLNLEDSSQWQLKNPYAFARRFNATLEEHTKRNGSVDRVMAFKALVLVVPNLPENFQLEEVLKETIRIYDQMKNNATPRPQGHLLFLSPGSRVIRLSA